MDRRNIVFNVVQDRSKTQTFTPTLLTMSNLHQQQQTAEKSVQTHDSTGSTNVLLANHPENTAAEVANTLVSMATGQQMRLTTVQPLNVISTPTQTVVSTSLPIISLAEYTTSRGVPTAAALANQAKMISKKQEKMSSNDEEDESMSVGDAEQTEKYANAAKTSRRGKKSKGRTSSKGKDASTVEAIQYGPILVKPRRRIAPTLSSGRKSKDQPLPPDEDVKRSLRRDRNKQAAAKCRKKRNELRDELEKIEQTLLAQQLNLQHSVENLTEHKNQLEQVLNRHACVNKVHLPIANTTANSFNIMKTDFKTMPTSALLDPNNARRVTINFSSAQDLFTVAPLTRTNSTTDGSSASGSSVPMITIHIIPEVAQALLGSTTVDKTRLVELLQQANAISLTSSSSTTTTDSTNSTH